MFHLCWKTVSNDDDEGVADNVDSNIGDGDSNRNTQSIFDCVQAYMCMAVCHCIQTKKCTNEINVIQTTKMYSIQ